MLHFDHLHEGTKFRLARVAAGMSLLDLGAKAGIAPPRLSEFERGYRVLPADALDRMRAILSHANRAEIPDAAA